MRAILAYDIRVEELLTVEGVVSGRAATCMAELAVLMNSWHPGPSTRERGKCHPGCGRGPYGTL